MRVAKRNTTPYTEERIGDELFTSTGDLRTKLNILIENLVSDTGVYQVGSPQ